MNLKRNVTRGAAWMVLYRLADRSLGLVSTLFLARLLIPADFGLVAMATSLIAILELLNAFGLDVALIQRAETTHVHFDTVWTLNVLAGLTIACLLVLLSWPMSIFYHEPRLMPVMWVLAVGSAAQGFENIGVVAFRKEMTFDREFRYLFTKRMFTFCVSLALAFTLRNYWALAISMTTGRLMGVAISYRMHPFRPRFSLAAIPDFMHFSLWVFAQNICFLLRERSADFIVGRISGPHAVGILSMSTEIAGMPGTELVAPINRAALPVYSKVAHDVASLGRHYLGVASVVALLVTPCVAGIGALGTVATALLLGPKWHDAAALISLIAFVGVANVLLNTTHPAVLAVGKPAVFARVTALQVALQIPALIFLTKAYGAYGAALGYVIPSVGLLPVNLWFILRAIGVRYRDYVQQVWRPLLAASAMYVLTRLAMPELDIAHLGTLEAISLLSKYAPLGAAIYIVSALLLWVVSGRPEGAELIVLRQLAFRWGRLRAAIGRQAGT